MALDSATVREPRAPRSGRACRPHAHADRRPAAPVMAGRAHARRGVNRAAAGGRGRARCGRGPARAAGRRSEAGGRPRAAGLPRCVRAIHRPRAGCPRGGRWRRSPRSGGARAFRSLAITELAGQLSSSAGPRRAVGARPGRRSAAGGSRRRRDTGRVRLGPRRDRRSVTRGARLDRRSLEAAERRRTGIRSLKVGFNKVFGYYIEITQRPRCQGSRRDYIRKQTLKNAERYITPELKEYEDEGPQRRRNGREQLEHELFATLRDALAAESAAVLRPGGRRRWPGRRAGAWPSCRAELGYCRPEIDRRAVLRSSAAGIRCSTRGCPAGEFVPNDARARTRTASTILIITGPNMAGKSTYIRQVALIDAAGADAAASCPPDERDDRPGRPHLHPRRRAATISAAGMSTFMVEMTETANILNNATAAQPGDPRRDRPRHQHLRRPVAGLGGRRAPARRTSAAARCSPRTTTS